MLPMRTGPVLLVAVEQVERRVFNKETKKWGSDGVVTRRDGSDLLEAVVQVRGEDRSRRFTLAADFDPGSMPEYGSMVEFELVTRPYQRAANGRDGRAYIKRDMIEEVTAVHVTDAVPETAAA